MTNKTMPERITIHRINNDETFPDNVCVTELKPGALLPDDIEEYEYVRADIATGDANEPLTDAIKEAMALLEVLEEDSAYGVLDAALKKHEENSND